MCCFMALMNEIWSYFMAPNCLYKTAALETKQKRLSVTFP